MLYKKILLGLATVAALLFWAQSCYYDKTVFVEEEVVLGDVSFNNDIIPLFNESCNFSGCHNDGGVPPVLSAGKAYSALQNGNYINVNAPEDSELYLWLTSRRSSPMPLSGPDPNINSKVLAWIKGGALDN